MLRVNVGLELSKRLLNVSATQRPLRVQDAMEDMLGEGAESMSILLDNLEVLFEPSLKQDPLRLLKGLSRNRTVVASLNGIAGDGGLTYADTDHPEYRHYSAPELGGLIVLGTETELKSTETLS